MGWYRRNPKAARVLRERENAKRHDKDPNVWKPTVKARMISGARTRAQRNGLPFSLLPDDFEIPNECPVLGIPLFPSKGTMGANSPTLDKIIPTLGYVPGNVVVVSARANRLKSDATIEELRCLVEFYG
jgi:hypothetical protein